jgi:hypothetical protein
VIFLRKGIGTTLGALIFLGILFSSIIPLQLYMKENKMLLIRTKNEVNVLDSYRELEDLDVLAYPTGLTSDDMLVKVKNKSPVPIVIRSVWLSDNAELVEYELRSGEEALLGPFSVILEEGKFYSVKVSTERGRVFTSDTGNLQFVNGSWYSPTLGICVQIANEMGKYYIKISNSTWSSVYQTVGMDQDDLLVFFDVKTNGYYYVICRKNSINGPDLPGTPMVVELAWPSRPPVIYVYTSGLDN